MAQDNVMHFMQIKRYYEHMMQIRMECNAMQLGNIMKHK